MGDHRVTISIKMHGHGITRELKNAWWNWSPGTYHENVDDRAVEFMAEAWADMYAKFHDDMWKADRERRERKEREEELAELERLKDKYERADTSRKDA